MSVRRMNRRFGVMFCLLLGISLATSLNLRLLDGHPLADDNEDDDRINTDNHLHESPSRFRKSVVSTSYSNGENIVQPFLRFRKASEMLDPFGTNWMKEQ
ncbi:hypothetical protein AB6A40_005710 [Gnathostoma spinigerum]|uniref:Uncharacterized protein n=1 Tax=Gnathostoma spinigerum TaxID=75299 RepID=A0ABD6ENJ3_9BILA